LWSMIHLKVPKLPVLSNGKVGKQFTKNDIQKGYKHMKTGMSLAHGGVLRHNV
jgi:hypothetical protein